MATWADARAAFEAAGDWFVATTASVDGAWDQPGLGEWDVRALVGHTSRSFLTVESYLAEPAGAVEVPDAVGYYRAIRTMVAGPGVVERGREAGRALGADLVAAATEIAGRVRSLVRGKDGSELLTTLAGGMRLVDYLPTRTFELVVHTADLCRALGIRAEVPAVAAATALDLVSRLAIVDGRAADLLLTVTGRPPPAGGFSVL